MGIEFNNQDSRLGYLNDKLDDLLDGINASYGEELFNELVERLQRTIDDFNEEIASLTEEVKGNSEKRAEIIHTLMEGQEMSQSSSTANDPDESNNLDSESIFHVKDNNDDIMNKISGSKYLDFNNDDYYNHNIKDCADLSKSNYLISIH